MLLSVIALSKLQPTAHQYSLPTNILRGGKQTVFDIYELYWWQNNSCVHHKMSGQIFGELNLSKSSPTYGNTCCKNDLSLLLITRTLLCRNCYINLSCIYLSFISPSHNVHWFNKIKTYDSLISLCIEGIFHIKHWISAHINTKSTEVTWKAFSCLLLGHSAVLMTWHDENLSKQNIWGNLEAKAYIYCC